MWLAKTTSCLPPCPSDYANDNALSGNATGSGGNCNNGIYETNGTIESTQVIINGTVIQYDSGIEIILNEGFEVDTNAIFNAFIDGCGGTQ